MKSYRLNRLFNAQSNRCFDVAVDHGFFNEGGFLKGIEDIEAVVATLVEANPDAIQLTIGQAPILQSLPGKGKPALVLRSDVANVYGTDLPDHLFSRVIEDAAEQAVRLDAACLVVNLFNIPGEPEVTWADTTKIERELGWKPVITFEEGIGAMLDNIDYWREAPLWDPASIQQATETWFNSFNR